MSESLLGPIQAATLDTITLIAGGADDTAVARAALSRVALGSFIGAFVDRLVFSRTALVAMLASGETEPRPLDD